MAAENWFKPLDYPPIKIDQQWPLPATAFINAIAGNTSAGIGVASSLQTLYIYFITNGSKAQKKTMPLLKDIFGHGNAEQIDWTSLLRETTRHYEESKTSSPTTPSTGKGLSICLERLALE